MDTLHVQYENPENLEKSKQFLETSLADDYDYPEEFYDIIQHLWKDNGIRECFARSNEYELIDSAKYFLDKADGFRQPDYIPTLQDILRCRLMTNSIIEINFEIKDGRQTRAKFKVFDVGGQQGERKKWIQLFNEVTAILFLVDSSSFDMTLHENRAKNRRVDAFEVFHQVWLNKYLQSVPILLFINKIDILEDKLCSGRTLDPLLDSVLSWNEYNRPNTSGHATAASTIPSSNSRRQSRSITRRSSLSVRKYLVSISRQTTIRQSRCSSVMEILTSLPYADFQPSDADQREFIYSFPIDDYGRTVNSIKGSRNTRELPRVLPETVRFACYIKRVFVEIVKFRAVADDGIPSKRDCKFLYTCAINTDNVQKVLESCRKFFIKEHPKRIGIL